MSRICFLMGVSRSASLARVVLLMIVCAMPLACNRSGGGMGNSSTPNGNANTSQDQPQNNKQAGGASNGASNAGQNNQSEPSMPADTVSGKPSTASDNGSPAAVSDRSVAEPGAPEGTIHAQKGEAQKGQAEQSQAKKSKRAPANGSPNP